MKHGKRFAEIAKAVDRSVLYDPEQAIALAKQVSVAKFDWQTPKPRKAPAGGLLV